jgi:hypothetical protein
MVTRAVNADQRVFVTGGELQHRIQSVFLSVIIADLIYIETKNISPTTLAQRGGLGTDR